MSDLGSEELEEEGEKYLGVRSPGKGGELPGVRGPLETGFGEWGGLEASHSPTGRPSQEQGPRRPQRALRPARWL